MPTASTASRDTREQMVTLLGYTSVCRSTATPPEGVAVVVAVEMVGMVAPWRFTMPIC